MIPRKSMCKYCNATLAACDVNWHLLKECSHYNCRYCTRNRLMHNWKQCPARKKSGNVTPIPTFVVKQLAEVVDKLTSQESCQQTFSTTSPSSVPDKISDCTTQDTYLSTTLYFTAPQPEYLRCMGSYGLVDTGAALPCLAGERAIDKHIKLLPPKQRSQVRVLGETKLLHNVTFGPAVPIPILKSIRCPLYLGNCWIMETIHIIKQDLPILIGLRFLTKHGIVLNTPQATARVIRTSNPTMVPLIHRSGHCCLNLLPDSTPATSAVQPQSDNNPQPEKQITVTKCRRLHRHWGHATTDTVYKYLTKTRRVH